MRSKQSQFKFLERGHEDTLVLIPGWATDYRIFDRLELDYNYLFLLKPGAGSFQRDLSEELNHLGLNRVSLLGWSLGGFLAADFSVCNPDSVNELFLLNVGTKFDHLLLKDIELKLRKNRRAFLYKFYQDCFFAAEAEGLSWFKRYLLKDYLDQANLEDLLKGLEYLSSAHLDPEGLSRVKRVKIINGDQDRIVPPQEASKVKSALPWALYFCLPGAGHISFLNPKFKEIFRDG